MKRLACILALVSLSACSWISRQADALGEYMPVIGDRCEHWQCVTDSGQQRSDAIKAAQQKQNQQVGTPDSKAAAPPVVPGTPGQDDEPPMHPLITAPPM